MNTINHTAKPNYIFETSWEVCNKVGGIYTVLSTKAKTLQDQFHDHIIFVGPDLNTPFQKTDFIEEPNIFVDWIKYAEENEQLHLKVGRWNIPGAPLVVLVDFKNFMPQRNQLFADMWDWFQVDSLHAYGDYDESCIFAYATALVIESYYRYYHLENKKVVALFNEWMLGMGALYIRKKVPAIGTIFITHATSIGRSIAGNNKPLYGYLSGYNGDQMAQELNMEAKHSVEKQAAHHAHCFTTVSDITATECEQLLEKAPDVVTLNGFEHDFVPKGEAYVVKRKAARKALFRVAEALLGYKIPDNALLIGTSGRYEYRNKGLDLFVEALNQTRSNHDLQKEIVAFIMVPGWVKGFRDDLRIKLDERDMFKSAPLPNPVITHDLYEQENDKILQYLSYLQMNNKPEENVKVIFVPCYLDGCDGIFNMSYYDLLIGFDATVFPSYYEPWGYTPLESVAFGIPTITTNLAGFGLWADKALGGADLKKGVAMIDRTDFNYNEAATAISKELVELSKMSKGERTEIRKQCFALADQACWSHFIRYYLQAFDIALHKASEEVSN